MILNYFNYVGLNADAITPGAMSMIPNSEEINVALLLVEGRRYPRRSRFFEIRLRRIAEELIHATL
jgi:hypothetical protein